MCRWRASVHHVRARTPRFACGGDDYLYSVLFHGSFQVRTIASPATALAAPAAAAIACAGPAVGMRLLWPLLLMRGCPLPMALWQAVGCCFIRAQLLAAEVASDKWQIQEWTFATVSAALSCYMLLHVLACEVAMCGVRPVTCLT